MMEHINVRLIQVKDIILLDAQLILQTHFENVETSWLL